MKKLRRILLLVTFAAAGAAWCVGQDVRPTTGPDELSPPPAPAPAGNLARSLANRPLAASQQDAAVAAQAAGQLTDQQRAEVLAFLQAEQPDLYAKLEGVRAAAPPGYGAMLGQVAQSVRPLMTLKESDPQLYGLYKQEMRVRQEIDRLRDAVAASRDPARRSELERKLRDQLLARFDLAQDRQRRLIEQSSQRIQRLRDQLEIRQANRFKIIEDQVKQIMDQARRGPAGGSTQPE